MSTLVRARTSGIEYSDASHALSGGIPSPFPTQAEREQQDILDSLSSEQIPSDIYSSLPGSSTVTPTSSETARQAESDEQYVNELPPSINDLRILCFTTLNDLLTTLRATPILPDRRHPTSNPFISSAPPSHTSALQNLISNLRSEENDGGTDTSDEALLLRELQDRVHRLASRLDVRQEQLARSLVLLLTHFHDLFELYPSSIITDSPRRLSLASNVPSPEEAFTNLRRHLNDFQLERSILGNNQSADKDGLRSPVRTVETALLWTRIDEELENLSTLCRSSTDDGRLPPEYDPADYEHDVEMMDSLPQYEAESTDTVFRKTPSPSVANDVDSIFATSTSGTLSEKMKMDLEAVTMAIDRLYMVAPQLHSQRVELKKTKLEQMERAKLLGKQKAVVPDDETKELEQIIALIGKASGRKLVDQSVEMTGSLKQKLEQAKIQDIQKQRAVVEQLVARSGAGRLSSQDAILRPPRLRSHTAQPSDKLQDPEALLTLPEFIREAVPQDIRRRMKLDEPDPEALLSLPEFIKESVPEHLIRSSRHSRGQSYSVSREGGMDMDIPSPKPVKALKTGKNRSRSLSAPPLAWLLSNSGSRISPVPEAKKSKSTRDSRPGSSHSRVEPIQEHLDISYVAEHHENLRHILVFFTIAGLAAGSQVEAEVVSNDGSAMGSQLALGCDSSTSTTLELPADVPVGRKDIKRVSENGDLFEIKLSSSALSSSPSPANDTSDVAILDATQLSSFAPTSLVCSSCSLPLVRASKLRSYRDLPSEHWAELVDAWMCHADLKLHEHVKKGSKEGFWPSIGDALVGGSYILVHEEDVVKSNLCEPEFEKYSDDWRRVRCICGAVVGRSREHTPSGGEPAMVYRFAKYAFRPISPTSEPSKFPLSAFIVEDMNEFIQAHATYRFVIVGEEDDRPRILVWLFKPNMRLSYTTPSQYFIPKTGSVRAAKVLYKALSPSIPYVELQSIINKYPGFPQAEHIYYPKDVCRRLVGLLRESNTAYPEHMRTMTGLDVGWLQRA